jgi:hypothetical protein
MWQLLTYLLYKDSISNKDTFIVTTNIHSLQGFYIHWNVCGGNEA